MKNHRNAFIISILFLKDAFLCTNLLVPLHSYWSSDHAIFLKHMLSLGLLYIWAWYSIYTQTIHLRIIIFNFYFLNYVIPFSVVSLLTTLLLFSSISFVLCCNNQIFLHLAFFLVSFSTLISFCVSFISKKGAILPLLLKIINSNFPVWLWKLTS